MCTHAKAPTQPPWCLRGALTLPVAVACLALLLRPLAASASGEPPVLVSPGQAAGVATIAERCPTFNWAWVDHSTTLDLMVYEANSIQGADPSLGEFVLRIRLPGGATGWTPALGQCLEPGKAYVWLIRSISRQREQVWSLPRVFRVAASPPHLGVSAAGARLPMMAEEDAAPAVDVGRHSAAAPPKRTDPPAKEPLAYSPARATRGAGAAAITARSFSGVGVDGTVYGEVGGIGVVGESSGSGNAADYIGVLGKGTSYGVVGEGLGEGGYGVVGVGTLAGAAALFINDEGGDVIAAAPDPVGGQPLFRVGDRGEVAATSFTGQGAGLSNLNGANLIAGSVTSAALATGSVYSDEIFDDSVTADDLAADSVGWVQLQDNSVDASIIVDNTVGSDEVTDHGLRLSDIVKGFNSVHYPEMIPAEPVYSPGDCRSSEHAIVFGSGSPGDWTIVLPVYHASFGFYGLVNTGSNALIQVCNQSTVPVAPPVGQLLRFIVIDPR